METGMEWVISFIFIAICAAEDIRKKEVPVAILALFGILSLVYIGVWGKREWMDVIFSFIPGVSLLLLSLCTRESIGYGDGLVTFVLGILMGWEGCLAVVMIGLLSSAVTALVLLICRKAGGKSRIPFVPFLAVGLGVLYVAQRGW